MGVFSKPHMGVFSKPSRRVVNKPPKAVVFIACVAFMLMCLPLLGLMQRTTWSSLFDLLNEDSVSESLRVSLMVSASATVICVVLGLPVALVLAHCQLRFYRAIRALVMLPMALPPVVAGTALLFALGRKGIVGERLYQWFGLQLPFTMSGAVVAAAFVSMPFFIATVESALRQAGCEVEDSAATLGAGPWSVLFYATIPSIRSAIVCGACLSWARAVGEFGATLTFAGNFPGKTRTLPMEVYIALEHNHERAVAISFLMMLVSIIMLAALQDRWMAK